MSNQSDSRNPSLDECATQKPALEHGTEHCSLLTVQRLYLHRRIPESVTDNSVTRRACKALPLNCITKTQPNRSVNNSEQKEKKRMGKNSKGKQNKQINERRVLEMK